MFFLRVQWRVRAVLLRWRRCWAWLLSGWCLRALLLSCGAAPAAARFVFFVGARAWWSWSRCVFVFLSRAAGVPVRVLGCRAAFFFGARRGRAVRVLGCCAAFFFLVRAAGGRSACLVAALVFFSWRAPRAGGAGAWWPRSFFFLARAAGGGCASFCGAWWCGVLAWRCGVCVLGEAREYVTSCL